MLLNLEELSTPLKELSRTVYLISSMFPKSFIDVKIFKIEIEKQQYIACIYIKMYKLYIQHSSNSLPAFPGSLKSFPDFVQRIFIGSNPQITLRYLIVAAKFLCNSFLKLPNHQTLQSVPDPQPLALNFVVSGLAIFYGSSITPKVFTLKSLVLCHFALKFCLKNFCALSP